jgi:cyclic pyranopterin phosphate synthase
MRKPHIRIALTSKCNFNCVYCQEGGEGVKTDEQLLFAELIDIITIANQIGFSHIKFTGGEPLYREFLYHDVITLIQYVKSNLSYQDIQLVTNGFYLIEYGEELAKSGLDSLTVSLDTNEAGLFNKITGSDSFDKVISGIRYVKSYSLPVTINSVYFSKNKNNISKLVDLALNLNCNLKILDCVDFPGNQTYYYHSFDDLYEYLGSLTSGTYDWIFPPGGLGTPMRQYNINGCKIITKDAHTGTNYNINTCSKCIYFPCQDALISLRITSNGKLKRCLIRNDNLIDIQEDVKNKQIDNVRKKLSECFNILKDSTYFQNKWKNA